MPNASVLRSKRAVANRHHARVGIRHTVTGCPVQSLLSNSLHLVIRIKPTTIALGLEFVEEYRLVQPRRSRSQRSSFTRNIYKKTASLQMISLGGFTRAIRARGISPHTAHFHLALHLGHLCRMALLFIYIRLDNLSR